ncbi:MAG: RNA polymerase sigma-70 factor [Tannerellaceae bacterium]|jgi:RNA polymerase sigma-70 factor (ECF subfamily)|nr:RNA polymerase sigma-70 factor [Tannerellaceae bacterium]
METTSELNTIKRLFEEYQGRLTRFAYSYTRDWSVAEDFTLEAYMYYWENRHSLTPEANIPAYILTIIKHKCLNYLEHLQVREGVAEKLRNHAAWELQMRISTLEACEPEELFTSEMLEIVRKTLAGLPAQTRRIFLMSRSENKTYKEIAAECGMSAKGVEFHIAKALKILRQNLKDYFPLLGMLLSELLS